MLTLCIIQNTHKFFLLGSIDLNLSWGALLLGSVLEFTPIMLCLLISPKYLRLKACLAISLISLSFTNYIYFIIARENISSELLRNINIYSIKGFFSWSFVVIIILLIIVINAISKKTIIPILKLKSTTRFKVSAIAFTSIITFLGYSKQNQIESKKYSGMEKMIYTGKKNNTIQLKTPSTYALYQAESNLRDDSKLKNYNFEIITDKEKKWLKKNAVGLPFEILPHHAPNIKRPKYIFVVTLESVPLSYFNKFNKRIPAEATPFFNELFDRYDSFDNFFTSGIPTDQGNAALLCSYPRFSEKRPANLKCLPEILKKLTYKSYLYRGASLLYAGHNHTYKSFFKFDQMYGSDQYQPLKTWGWGHPDQYVLKKALIDTINRNEKQLIVVNLIDTHPPYLTDNSPIEHEDKLIRSLALADKNIKEFIQNVKNSKIWNESLIIITSDHSPNHGSYLKWTEEKNYQPARIPLFFLGGFDNIERLQGINKNLLYSQLDILPTIEHFLQLPTKFSRLGTSMLMEQKISNRTYVPSFFGSKIMLHTLTDNFLTDVSHIDLKTIGKTSGSNSIRKFIINNFFVDSKSN